MDSHFKFQGAIISKKASVSELRSVIDSGGRSGTGGLDRRWAAFEALGYSNEPGALSALVSYLDSSDWTMRRAAVAAIRNQEHAASVLPRIRSLLGDKSEYVVVQTCGTLARLGDESSRKEMCRLCRSPSVEIRIAAIDGLTSIWNSTCLPVVLDRFGHDKSNRVRQCAAYVLNTIAGTENYAIIFDVFSRDRLDSCRLSACLLAERFNAKEFKEQLKTLCDDKNGHVRRAARRALQAIAAEHVQSPAQERKTATRAPLAKRRSISKRKSEYPENDGWTSIDYRFTRNEAFDIRFSEILNAAVHVFRHHAGGTWKTRDKDRYASLIAEAISQHPSLVRKLLDTGDRVLMMLTYRAIELNKKAEQPHT